MVLVACGATADVRSTRRDAVPEVFERDGALAAVVDLPAIDPIEWAECDGQPQPWECASIEVPLDYRRPESGGVVEIAVTRLPAADTAHRIGALVVNPGGPGGSGLDLAWNDAAVFPRQLLDRFDLVGFDPRGVGRSSAVECGTEDHSYDVEIEECVRLSGDLLPYVGTLNSARDLEQLRKALGDEQLTYLGFSYGTALGAVYADLFPASVRALVLDGSVDPEAGRYNVDGTTVGSYGTPFYGVQDFLGTIDVFAELCDATHACPLGPRTWQQLDELLRDIDRADTDHFDEWDEEVTAEQLVGIVTSAMYNTDLWAPLAVALADAVEGDASALAALGSFLEAGYPRLEDAGDNMIEANLAIYCADFAGRSGRFEVEWCAGWPETAEPLAPIGEVDLDRPVVVIGTDGDPATPGVLAPLMAAALGDAVTIRWEGAGHTAFLHSECVDRLVIDYLVDLEVPRDRSRCDFTDGTDTTVARAAQVFTLDRDRFRRRLESVFIAEGRPAAIAACLAERLAADASDAVLVYARLGVQHPEYVDLRTRLAAECAGR
jgi:pimeloyl-ACP methyl ester carboxylesterase